MEKVYISVAKKASIDTELDVLVRDIGEVFCTNEKLRLAINNILIKKKNKEEDWDNITAIQIAQKILGKYPDIDLDLLGEPEILLEYKSQQVKNPFLGFVKVALVCIILFFGAGLAITNFHEDVNTKASMSKLYFTFTGVKKENPLIMNIPYSIGIGVGVVTFFNRILSQSKRRKMEPGPMEIELYLYDQDMEAQISNEVKKNKES